MPKSKTTNQNQPTADSTKNKKSVPVNHVILKRIGDLKTLVDDLSGSNQDKALANLDLSDEIQKQSSEIEKLRDELSRFQSGLLGSFCDALDERLLRASESGQRFTENDQSRSSVAQTDAVVGEQREEGESAKRTLADQDTGSWESIRSAMLVEHESPEKAGDSLTSRPTNCVSHESQSSEAGAECESIRQSQGELSAVKSEDLVTHTDNVEDVEIDFDFIHSDIIADLDSLDETALKSVVEKQEQLISVLIRRLRTRHNNRPTMTSEQLESVQSLASDELSEEIHRTLAVLHSQQRQGELELSLERAKLSRRRTELEELEARIGGRARTLGLTIDQDGNLKDAANTGQAAGSKSRRWLGALGFGQ